MQQTAFTKKRSHFWKMFSGQFVSMITSQIVQYSLIWFLTDTTKSPSILAWSTIVAFIPGVLFGPFVGSLIDRSNKKLLMIGADWLVAIAAIAIYFFDIFGDVTIYIVFIALFVRSLASVIQSPTMQSIIPTLVPEDFVPKVSGINGMVNSAIMLVSPAIGAAMYSSMSLGNVMILDVVGAVFGTISMLITPVISFVGKNAPKTHFLHDLQLGWNYLTQQRGIFVISIVTVISTFFVMPAFSMYPLLTTNYFGGTITDASYVETVWAIGSLLGGIIISVFATVHRRFTIFSIGMFFSGLSFAGMGLLEGKKESLFAFMIINVFGGLFYMIGVGIENSIISQGFPAEKLGRVLAITMTMGNVAGPLGLVFADPLSRIMGLNGLIIMAGMTLMIGTIISMSFKSARDIDRMEIMTEAEKTSK